MCLQDRQAGKAVLASNGDHMGHGPWGQGWSQYTGGFNRRGKSEGRGGRRSSLTSYPTGCESLLQGHQSHTPPMQQAL